MFVGIDIGGTTARVAAYSGAAEVDELHRLEFSMTKSPSGDFELDMENLIHSCWLLANNYGNIEGIGLSVAGKVSHDRQTLTGAGNIGHWVGKPICRELRSSFNCPVALGNDAEAAAMAEALYGHGTESDFWFVIWGTGVGGCLVRQVNGTPVPFAGELGHQFTPLRYNLAKCGCGQDGCVEAYAGGGKIIEYHGTTPDKLQPIVWDEIVGVMAIAIRNAVVLQPTPRVVFGGGIANKQPQALESIRQKLVDTLRIVEAPEICLSAFGEAAGTVGALALLGLKTSRL